MTNSTPSKSAGEYIVGPEYTGGTYGYMKTVVDSSQTQSDKDEFTNSKSSLHWNADGRLARFVGESKDTSI
jgi:hypothetical protein